VLYVFLGKFYLSNKFVLCVIQGTGAEALASKMLCNEIKYFKSEGFGPLKIFLPSAGSSRLFRKK